LVKWGNPVKGYPWVVLAFVAVFVEDDFDDGSRDGRKQYDHGVLLGFGD
jgi:hypothetical protein